MSFFGEDDDDVTEGEFEEINDIEGLDSEELEEEEAEEIAEGEYEELEEILEEEPEIVSSIEDYTEAEFDEMSYLSTESSGDLYTHFAYYSDAVAFCLEYPGVFDIVMDDDGEFGVYRDYPNGVA